MSTGSPSARAGARPAAIAPGPRTGPPAASPQSPLSIAVRGLLSLAILAGFFAAYTQVIDLVTSILHSFSDAEPAVLGRSARVIVVTVLGLLLVAVWWRIVKADVRFHAPILITFILAIGNATYGILENFHSDWLAQVTGGLITEYSPTFVAIIVTVFAELVLSRFLGGQWPHLASAYITGISVGILIKSPDVLPFILCGLLSIVSKYAIRIGGRHIWNPSNLGVTLMVFFWSYRVAALSVQFSNEIWPNLIIWFFGALILFRLGKLHITVTYAVAFLLLGFVRSAVTHDPWKVEVAPITGPPYQLFMFFMITDPKTVTKAKWSQCVVAVTVAIVETIFRLPPFEQVYAPYYALFIVGPTANLIEIWWYSRHPAAKAKGAPVAPASTASAPALPVEPAPTGGA